MTKFTEGDWKICPVEEDKEYIRVRGIINGGLCLYKIANVIDLKNHHSGEAWCKIGREQAMANAHLIKTSPKLYKELQDLAEWLEYREDYKGWYKRVCDVLSEARGEH